MILFSRALQIIQNEIYSSLNKQGFEFKQIEKEAIVFLNKEETYKILLNRSNSAFELQKAIADEDDLNKFSVVASWLFSPQEDTEKDIKLIASEFLEAMCIKGENPKMPKAIKSKKNDDDKTVDALFLMNRLATIFPELKAEIKYEKENFSKFRGVTFAQDKALPIILPVLNTAKPTEKFNKLCSTLSALYLSGNLDVRAIVTIIFLNSVESSGAIEKIGEKIKPELKKAFAASRKIKGKNIRPEKAKKEKRNIFAQTLNSSK